MVFIDKEKVRLPSGVTRLRSIVNRDVVNFRGQKVGNIDDVVINVDNGQVDGVLVKTEQQIAKLPWEALNYDPQKGAFELHANQGRSRA